MVLYSLYFFAHIHQKLQFAAVNPSLFHIFMYPYILYFFNMSIPQINRNMHNTPLKIVIHIHIGLTCSSIPSRTSLRQWSCLYIALPRILLQNMPIFLFYLLYIFTECSPNRFFLFLILTTTKNLLTHTHTGLSMLFSFFLCTTF